MNDKKGHSIVKDTVTALLISQTAFLFVEISRRRVQSGRTPGFTERHQRVLGRFSRHAARILGQVYLTSGDATCQRKGARETEAETRT